MIVDASVSTWIGLLKTGKEEAAQELWERFFPQMIHMARDKLRGLPRCDADEEDVALSAFDAFCRAAANQRIPQLNDREDLWRTLVLITAGKAVDRRRYLNARKRDAPEGVVESELALLEELVGQEPDPALAAIVAEECQTLLLRLEDEELQQIALAKLEGYTNEEIADQLNCSLRTVKRRLSLIRRAWESTADGAGA